MSELNRILQAAQTEYQAGNWAAAEAHCLWVVQRQPQSITALSWLAAIAERTSKPDVGIAYYRQILLLNPGLSEIHSNLGSLLCQQGQIAEAIVHHEQALILAPDDPDACYNLGVALYQNGQLEAAATHYRQAIQLQPEYANAHNNLGVTLCQLKQRQEAIAHYQQAVLHNPNHANAHNNLGVALAQAGQTEAAIGHYQQALELDSTVPNVYDNLGTALKELGRLGEAIAHYQRAIELRPDQASSYDNLGTALQAQGKLDAAIDYYHQAIVRDPGYANAYGNLASTLKEQGNLKQAVAACEQGLELQPENTHVHNVYGGILADRGEIAEAIVHFEQALQSQPDHPDTHLNLGMMLLAAGDFGRGFVEYHWRWQTNQCPDLRYRQALWNGGDLKGRVILLTAEQGFGDTIQFVRYAALVAQKGGLVVIACQTHLVRLLQTVPGATRCVDRDRVDVDTHVHAPLLDLPLLLGTRLETVPAAVPYLSPPQDSAIRLRDFPAASFKVGFVWATNPANSTSIQRSCELAHFLELLEIPGIALYSLQKDCSEADRALLEAYDRLQDLHEQIRDFADTAAAIDQLDLIISVDTAVAHLAGALAKPVWTLLPFSPDWRWMRDRANSPWYPTMRLFRQQKAGDWATVFGQVQQALLEEVGKNSRLIQSSPSLQRAEAVGKEEAIVLNNRATDLMRQGELEAAVLLYRQAIELHPDHATAYSNLGIALKDLQQPEAAIPYFQQALHLQPDRADIYNSYGCTLIDLGRPEAAIEQFRRSLGQDSGHADAHLNLGMALLMLGQFQAGFAEYRWRWRNKLDHALPYPEALWDGSDLNGKTILLTAEQGFGDTIQFVRYAALVAQKGGQVVVACQKSLMRLLQNAEGVDRCIDRNTEAAQTHFHAPLLELPRIFATTPATIPAQPYLSVPSSSFCLPSASGFKIGIAWATSPTSSTAGRRSCPLVHFLELLRIPGIALYSLQKNPCEADRARLRSNSIFDLDPQLQDFADTAAAIDQLDLVISVDTAVAHLAGALGRPVWTVLPFAPDWRWMRDRADSPWYPTMRLFRQQRAGDWAGLFLQIHAEVSERRDKSQREAGIEKLSCLADGSRGLKQGRHGVFLYGNFYDDGEVGRSLDLYGEWRAAALNLLQHLIRPGDTIVEVGANVGVQTLFFSEAVGTAGKVVAIESDRLTFQTLCANLALNSLTNVHAYSSGAIDDLELATCRLIVLHGDAALPSLKAADRTIQAAQPIVYVAASPQESAAIAQLLKPLGYDLYWHPVPWYSADNFDRNPQNVFGALTTDYLFGLPRSFGITVNGLQPVA